MPAQGTKRSAASAVGPKAKAARKDTAVGRRQTIIDAISAAAGLSESCREMLCAVVPSSFGVPPAERDSYQTGAVAIVGQALVQREAVLTAEADAAREEAASLSEQKVSADNERAQLEGALLAKKEEVGAKELQLSECSSSADACATALKAAKDAQRGLDVELKTITLEKTAFEKAIAEDFEVLRDSLPSDKRVIARHMRSVEKVLDPLGLGQALTFGLPASLTKLPERRGPFDELLLDHVSKVLASEVSARSERLNCSENEKADHSVAVETAQATLDTAIAEKQAALEALKAARAEEVDISIELEAADRRAGELEKNAATAADGEQEKKAALEAFQAVIATYHVERDGVAAVAEAEAAEPPAVSKVEASANEAVLPLASGGA